MRKSNPEYYKSYYGQQAQQKGGQLPVFHGGIFQNGYGLGSFLKGIYRWAIPHVSSGIKTIGKHALKEAVGVGQDVLSGETIGNSLIRRGKKAINSITTHNTPQPQKGGGGKKLIKRKAPAKRVSRASTKKRKTPQSKRQDFNNFFN